MSWKLANILAISALGLVFVLFELGAMGPANAFFFAAATLTFYTAYQFLRRDGMRMDEALKSIAVPPRNSTGRMRTYATYAGCTLVGLIVTVQAIATSV